MKFTRTPIASAMLALCASAPFAAHAISVSFNAPSSGAVLTNVTFNQTSGCQVSGSDIRRVVFSLVSSSGQTTTLNTETGSPWQCNLNSRNFADGNYTLRAVAYDSSNRSATATRPVTIRNQTTDASPTISITAPANNATVNKVTTCTANARDDRGISRVQFFVDGTLLSTDTSGPYTCSLDNTKYTNGAHTLVARVTDNAGKTTDAQIAFNVTGGIGSTPPPTGGNPAPVVSFKSPASGTKIASGGSLNSCEVNATDANGIEKIEFYMNNTLYVTEKIAPYTCGFGSGKFADGTYTLKAVATDKLGAKAETQISLTIGSGSTTPPSDTTPPTVSISAPGTGTKLAGAATAYTASASDNTGVAKVEMVLKSGATEKVVDTKTSAPYSGTLNTAGLPNGPAVLMARATDSAGLTSTVQRDVTIENTVTPPPDPNPNPGTGTGTTLPSTNAKGVATFESLGMYWKPGSAPSGGTCNIRYRKHSETAWKEALPMWYDSRDSECRGSIVHLAPGTDYAVEMGANGSYTAGVNIKTWSESFPIAQTIQVQSGSQTLKITQGGTKDGYVLYTGPATLDAANAVDYNIDISAKYVIIRGLTLKGAKRDGIRLAEGASDVVIEDNDISGWGRQGVDRDSAVNANCPGWSAKLERIVVQRNKMHHPRYNANSWDGDVHPAGPQAVTFNTCAGNHVLRYNEVYSTDGGNYFNDGFSGGPNYSSTGFPLSDTDIYGNRISHTRDDGIEAEGSNKNNRIWGNYLDQVAIGVASTVVHNGPLYIFRNVHNRNRQRWQVSLDSSTSRSGFFKAGMGNGFGNGRRYVFHNTMLQATQSGVSSTLGAAIGLQGNSGQPLTNTVSRNNIFHVWKAGAVSIGQHSGSTGNDFDYDLFNGSLSSISGMERNGKVGVPTYASGHGWSSWGNGNYQLQPGSLGHDQGARLPNFNDAFTGNAPDMGAHESGTPAMALGVSGSSTQWAAPAAGTSTATSSTPSTPTAGTGSGTTTTADSGVCSTASCVLGQ
jgi:hypothetical protein